jgi:hypothetical protein
MQKIYPCSLSPEEYNKTEHHSQVQCDSVCPHCQKALGLRALGYYIRWITTLLGTPLQIRVRRFRCRSCKGNVSYLPSFAQTYRVVHPQIVQDFIDGQQPSNAMQRWWGLLQAYRRSWQKWAQTLRQELGCAFGRPAENETDSSFWQRLRKHGGSVMELMIQLIKGWKVTLFGRYCCHQQRGQDRFSQG